MPFTSLDKLISTGEQLRLPSKSRGYVEQVYQGTVTEVLSYALKKAKAERVLTLRQDSMSIMEYEGYFVEISRFTTEYVASNQIKMLRFEEGLVPYILSLIHI